MGLPRAYLVCLLFVKHSFSDVRDRSEGGALRGLLATGKYSAPVRSQLSKIITIAEMIALSPSSSLRAHLGTFVLLALERFFCLLALMVLDFGRVINLT